MVDLHNVYDESPASRPGRPRRTAQIDDETAEDIQRRMATMMVRRMCNQKDHACTAPQTGSCEHPNHRRDADYLLNTDKDSPGMLDMLGLDHAYPAYTEAEHALWLAWLRQSGPPDASLDVT